jgi:hypothetical protein
VTLIKSYTKNKLTTFDYYVIISNKRDPSILSAASVLITNVCNPSERRFLIFASVLFSGRWIARACKNGKEIYLGCFLHKEDACRAREHFLETGIILKKNDAS